MIIFPKYTRKQNLACKLFCSEIKKIRGLREQGFTLKNLAKIFRVCQPTICYWLLSLEERKEFRKKQYLLYDRFRDRKDKQKRQRKSLKRKRVLMPEFYEYNRQFEK